MAVLIHSIALAAAVLSAAYFALLVYGAYRRQARLAELHQDERAVFMERLQQVSAPVSRLASQQGPAWSGFRKFRIDGKVLEADGICSFYLVPHDGRPLPPFYPGQYLTFRLPIPGQAREVTRCYSLSDSPDHTDYYRVTIKRIPPPPGQPAAPGGLVSGHFHDRLRVGDFLDIKAPGGHFHLDVEHRGPVVLVGGGIGITPVLSMLGHLAATQAGREAWLFYGVRNSSEHVMQDFLKEVAVEHRNLHVVVCYSDPLPEDRQGEHYDFAERVSVELFKRVLKVNNFDFYICGPPPMMQSLTEGLAAWGVPEARVHFEAFGPASVKKAGQPAAPAAAVAGFQVTFTRSNRTLVWPGAGSLLEFAEANGIQIDSGCRAGNCGTCATAVRDGQVDYLSAPGAEIEKGSCLACIAVPKSALSVDA